MEWTNIFKDFFNSEKISGALLLFCTILSLFLANSALGDCYVQFWHLRLDIALSNVTSHYTVEQWINDGLMTLFFLLVGLEIKRELYCGELSSFANAFLPFAGAVGGMVFPALIHFLFNAGTATQNGFGIPMATDIAFSLGVLSLAGDRSPHSLKIFLTALAIIDDIGAILVIALFYSGSIQWIYIAATAGITCLLAILNRFGLQVLAVYLLLGALLWYCLLRAGIHPTLAGVALAFFIPFGNGSETSPSSRLQKALHKPVAYFIMPLFALANTGIVLKAGWLAAVRSSNSLGIMAGLVIGKPLGILLFCWLLIRFSRVNLPSNASWRNMFGVAVLAGIGFTVSIFIANLAFKNNDTVANSKVAVLAASFLAIVAGLLLLFRQQKPALKK